MKSRGLAARILPRLRGAQPGRAPRTWGLWWCSGEEAASPRASGLTPCCTPRFCGSVAPPTFNTNSNHLRVTFVSDSSVGAPGFSARYRAVAPSESEYSHTATARTPCCGQALGSTGGSPVTAGGGEVAW